MWCIRICILPWAARCVHRFSMDYAVRLWSIDMAYAEHGIPDSFLNLAYTPGKAISMKDCRRGCTKCAQGRLSGLAPVDTLFKDFRVSYSQDLSELNRLPAFYSNNTQTQPVAPRELQAVAGCGSSPVVSYQERALFRQAGRGCLATGGYADAVLDSVTLCQTFIEEGGRGGDKPCLGYETESARFEREL